MVIILPFGAIACIVTLLLFILLSGVVCLIKEVIKHFLNRQALKNELAELQSSFNDYQDKTSNRLSQYENKISDLEKQVKDYVTSNSKTLEQSDQDVAQIINLVDHFVELNDLLFIKISAIDRSLSPEHTITGPQLDELKTILQNDIEKQAELKEQFETYRKEVLERTHKQQLKEKYRDIDLEL